MNNPIFKIMSKKLFVCENEAVVTLETKEKMAFSLR
jgi:hypothetical protein